MVRRCSTRRRLRQLAQHLAPTTQHDSARQNLPSPCGASDAAPATAVTNSDSNLEVVSMMDPEWAWTRELRGTIWEDFSGDIQLAEAELAKAAGGLFDGTVHQEMESMRLNFDSENFTLPRTSHVAEGQRPRLEPWLVISNPDDAVRIARMHTKKARIYGPSFLGGGLFGLTDNEEWRAQRYHIVLGLLPVSSLSSHFGTVAAEALKFVDLLSGAAVSGEAVEMSEMLAAKTLSVFGKTLFDQERAFLEHSEAIRWAYTWDLAGFLPVENTTQMVMPSRGIVGGVAERAYAVEIGVLDGTASPGSAAEKAQVRSFVNEFSAGCLTRARAKMAVAGRGPPVDMLEMESKLNELAGPGALINVAAGLDKMQREHEPEWPAAHISAHNGHPTDATQSQLDTVSCLIFAGHDTTANTLSWCCYELARNPAAQIKLQAELDAFYEALTKPLAYTDLAGLPYLTRCLHETLRLWPIVQYGSMRELQRPAKVSGIGGAEVTIPTGTQVQLPPFALHHSTALWGPTAVEFDPDRDFTDKELYGVTDDGRPLGLMGWNPKSDRFAPFQSAPRQCLGLNFAQMEMRLILSALLRSYDLSLAGPTSNPLHPRADLAIARPLLRPAHGIWLKLTPRSTGAADCGPLGPSA